MTNGFRVLVAFASRFGSTRGVAERIAERLRVAGCTVHAVPAEKGRDVSTYDAVVLGSAVFDGSWLPEAVAFARRNAATLSARPAWIFSVAAFGDTHRLLGRLVKREPREIGELTAALHPREYRVFAGRMEPQHWSLAGRLILKAFGGHDGDNRDWPQIDLWAAGIARALEAENAEKTFFGRASWPHSWRNPARTSPPSRRLASGPGMEPASSAISPHTP